jgi:hypothetical protein
VFIVWQPVLPSDDVEDGAAHAAALRDARVQHFFDTGNRLGHAYAKPLDSPFDTVGHIAWDVILLFDRGTLWKEAVPKPRLYRFPMALSSGVPAWDARAFADEVKKQLGAAAPGAR